MHRHRYNLRVNSFLCFLFYLIAQLKHELILKEESCALFEKLIDLLR